MIELICMDNYEENAIMGNLQRIYIIPIDKILHVSVEYEDLENSIGCFVKLITGETLLCNEKIDVVLAKIRKVSK